MDVYQFNTARYDEARFEFADRVRIARLADFVGAGKTVLDVACFDGTIGEMLMRRGNSVYGVDASAQAIAHARRKGVIASLANLEEPLELKSERFDAVIAGEIIEHVYHVGQFLSEIHRVLKPGGILALPTPNLAAFGRRLLLLLNRNPHIEISFTGEAAGHIRYFIRDTLFEILRKHRFRVLELTSDVINLNASGTVRLVRMAGLIPTLGRSLIVKAERV